MDDRKDVRDGGTQGSGSPPRASHAGGGAAETGVGKRFSAKRKLAAVQRLMRGESLDAVSRDMGVRAHRLSDRRDRAWPVLRLNLNMPG